MPPVAPEVAEQVARAQVYAFLSGLFARPEPARLEKLVAAIPELIEALNLLGVLLEVRHAAGVITTLLRQSDSAALTKDWFACFDASGGLLVPPTETHYTTETPAHGMTRGYEMADVAAFYKAFGVQVRAESERPDHVVAELDFLHVLALKLAVALSEGNEEGIEVCREARVRFMVDHVTRWIGMFAELLNETEHVPLDGADEAVPDGAIGPFYPAAGRLLLTFMQNEVLHSEEPVVE